MGDLVFDWNGEGVLTRLEPCTMNIMKNVCLGLFATYGIVVSSVSLYWGLAKDMPALEHAVRVEHKNAELRHRINVFADGTWLLLGNLITVMSISSIKQKDKAGV